MRTIDRQRCRARVGHKVFGIRRARWEAVELATDLFDQLLYNIRTITSSACCQRLQLPGNNVRRSARQEVPRPEVQVLLYCTHTWVRDAL